MARAPREQARPAHGGRVRVRARGAPQAVCLLRGPHGQPRGVGPCVREERVLPVRRGRAGDKVDDDGDGWPDTLEDGLPVRTARPYAGGVLPEGVAEHVGPLLAAIDRAGLLYEALATNRRGGAQTTSGHTESTPVGWTALQRSLRAWDRDGGRLLSRDREPAALRWRDAGVRGADAARPLRRASRQRHRGAGPDAERTRSTASSTTVSSGRSTPTRARRRRRARPGRRLHPRTRTRRPRRVALGEGVVVGLGVPAAQQRPGAGERS